MEVQANNKTCNVDCDATAVNFVIQYLEDKNINNAGDIFIVWSSYILGNRKYLIGTSDTNKYFEVTYNKTKDEWYLDVYNAVDKYLYKKSTN